MFAIYFGHEGRLQQLIDEINAQDRWGRTALMLAARKGHMNLIELLAKAGSKLDVEDIWNQSYQDYMIFAEATI